MQATLANEVAARNQKKEEYAKQRE